MNKEEETNLVNLAKKIRMNCLLMALNSGKNGSHLGGGLSLIEVFTVLYGKVISIDLIKSKDLNRDRIIISKGHCVLPYYSILNEYGLIGNDEIENFETNGSVLHGHATRNIEKGIEFSGGSLGLGLSFAVGVALAGKLNRSNHHVYVILGDGECNEGIIWEGLMASSHFKLNNLTIIIDNNKLQYDGESKKVMNLGSLATKFESFGFHTAEVDGHNITQLYLAFKNRSIEKPNVIIANTIKGKGVSFMENKREWHHSVLTLDQYDQAISEI